MGSQKTGLTELGESIQSALTDETQPPEHIRAARVAVVRHVTSRVGQRSAIGQGALRYALIAAGLSVLAAFSAWRWLTQPVSFEIGAAPGLGQIGDLVQAKPGEALPLRFSEGSSIVLRDQGRMRVLAAKSAGARVLLEAGTAEVMVVHDAKRPKHWSFEAGPFGVAVTGTAFVMSWTPKPGASKAGAFEPGELSLRMKEGSVVVTGPCLQQPRTITSGAEVRLACPVPDLSAKLEPSASPLNLDLAPALTALPSLAQEAGSREAAALQESRSAELARPEHSSPLGPSSSSPPAPAVASASPLRAHAAGLPPVTAERGWREALRAGRLTEALKAAEAANIETVCEQASHGELLELADAARLSGKSNLAIAALLALRRRFSGSSDAATAAFALGRIAYEQRRDYRGASRWFRAYLDELPQGPLVGDAAGRLMEARYKQGDRAAAKSEAERYLGRFPHGPYAPEAKRILSE